jgi:hypothetical protein
MRLSRGWRDLALFWAGIGVLAGVGAGILEMMGPPASVENSAQDERADSISFEFANRVPVAFSAVAAAGEAPSDVNETAAPLAREASPGAAIMVAHGTTSSMDPVAAPFDAWAVIPYQPTPAASADRNETSAGARQETPLPEKTRLLRITRDHKLCPQVVCYKWHLVTQRAKLPRAATIDLAQLRLAPSLREATENGEVELIINAVERRKGRENVTFVATSLYGVMPHDEPR